MTSTDARRQHAYYDDVDLNYSDYWTGRSYEHAAEVMAVRRLLTGHVFEHAVDVGGGYGRLSIVLADYARRVTLADSSQQQLDLATTFLAAYPQISAARMHADALQLGDASADLGMMVRVLHHLPEPAAELREVYRILRQGGYAVIEVANVAHAVNRIRYLVKRTAIPLAPVDILPPHLRSEDGIPFVNHHPATVVGLLRQTGFQLERTLSVSNLRHRAATRILPRPALLAVERGLQERLASLYFGPSVFLFLRKPR
jgi:ubiquinone/menaquinone biosynthesis C-methylase UbiE